MYNFIRVHGGMITGLFSRRELTAVLLGSIALSAGGFFVVFADAQQYNDPQANPPAGNTPQVINVGPTTQSKQGAIGADTFYDADDNAFFADPDGLSVLQGAGSSKRTAINVTDAIIQNVRDPQRDQDVATKAYVDFIASGGSGPSWIDNLPLQKQNGEEFLMQGPIDRFGPDVYGPYAFPYNEMTINSPFDTLFDSDTGDRLLLESTGDLGFYNNRYFHLTSAGGCGGFGPPCRPGFLGKTADNIYFVLVRKINGFSAPSARIYSYHIETNTLTLLDTISGHNYPNAQIETLGFGGFLHQDKLYATDTLGNVHIFDTTTDTKITQIPSGIFLNQVPAWWCPGCNAQERLIGGVSIEGTAYLVSGYWKPPWPCWGSACNFVNRELRFHTINPSTYTITHVGTHGWVGDKASGMLIDAMTNNRIAFITLDSSQTALNFQPVYDIHAIDTTTWTETDTYTLNDVGLQILQKDPSFDVYNNVIFIGNASGYSISGPNIMWTYRYE